MTCLYRFQQVAARVHATLYYPAPSIFVRLRSLATDHVKRILKGLSPYIGTTFLGEINLPKKEIYHTNMMLECNLKLVS